MFKFTINGGDAVVFARDFAEMVYEVESEHGDGYIETVKRERAMSFEGVCKMAFGQACVMRPNIRDEFAWVEHNLWEYVSTGGGCMAYAQSNPENSEEYILVTDNGGISAPNEDDYAIGFYTEESEGAEAYCFQYTPERGFEDITQPRKPSRYSFPTHPNWVSPADCDPRIMPDWMENISYCNDECPSFGWTRTARDGNTEAIVNLSLGWAGDEDYSAYVVWVSINGDQIGLPAYNGHSFAEAIATATRIRVAVEALFREV